MAAPRAVATQVTGSTRRTGTSSAAPAPKMPAMAPAGSRPRAMACCAASTEST